jgi:hypothetical protein
MARFDTLNQLPRRHAVTYRDVLAPGETPDQPLPATGALCTFRLQTGPKPVGRKVEALVELQSEAPPPSLRINGALCDSPKVENGKVLVYAVPGEALADRCHVLEVMSDSPVTIVRVEFAVS